VEEMPIEKTPMAYEWILKPPHRFIPFSPRLREDLFAHEEWSNTDFPAANSVCKRLNSGLEPSVHEISSRPWMQQA